MAKCSFCSKKIEAGTGKMLIQKTGKIFWLCSNRCEKNFFKLHRDPRDFKWTREKKA